MFAALPDKTAEPYWAIVVFLFFNSVYTTFTTKVFVLVPKRP
jgi:hypothetical protein